MLTAYKKAVQLVGHYVPQCRGLRWPVLAGIAKVESNHAIGRTIADNGDIRPRIYGVLLNGSGQGGNTTDFPDTDGGKWDGTANGERAVGPFQFLYVSSRGRRERREDHDGPATDRRAS